MDFNAAHLWLYFVHLKIKSSEEVTTNLVAELALESLCSQSLGEIPSVWLRVDLGELSQP